MSAVEYDHSEIGSKEGKKKLAIRLRSSTYKECENGEVSHQKSLVPITGHSAKRKKRG